MSVASTFLGPPSFHIVLDMGVDAIQCSKIVVINILPYEELWTESVHSVLDRKHSFETKYNPEKDCCGLTSEGWDQFICISDQPGR